MDLNRLGVLIWLLLPIPVYGLVRRWYHAQIRKFPAISPAKIVEIVSYGGYGEYDDVGNTNVTYSFNVAGTEYTGQATVGGRHHKPGQELPVPIRFNPNRPAESRLDNLRSSVNGWVLVGLIVLGIDLGFDIIFISFGLIFIYSGLAYAFRLGALKQFTPLRRGLSSIMCILVGLPIVIAGVYILIKDGFLAQNLLWAFWNP